MSTSYPKKKIDNYFLSNLNESIEVKKNLYKQKGNFYKLFKIVEKCVEKGNKIFFFGNGGSASDAQHLATELTVRYKFNRKAISAISLATDTSAITAISNDFGYKYLFSRQIYALGKKGDVAIGITTSGKSSNVINAFKVSRKLKIKTIGFLGGKKSKCENFCDAYINVPSNTTARIQECHITIGQILCGLIEEKYKNTENRI